MPDLGSTEMTMLWASLLLGLIYLVAADVANVAKRGLGWALGARDEAAADAGPLAGRLERAWKNYLETLPIFVGAVLVEASAGHGSGLGPLGAQLYFWARVIYLPAYATAVPYVRTVSWLVSIAGIVLLLLACVPGL